MVSGAFLIVLILISDTIEYVVMCNQIVDGASMETNQNIRWKRYE